MFPRNHTRAADNLWITKYIIQVLYTGRFQSLGIKQGGPAQGKWAELPITKSPKITSCAVGHEAQHGLLLADDGSVFFVGTARKGEDGDSNSSRS